MLTMSEIKTPELYVLRDDPAIKELSVKCVEAMIEEGWRERTIPEDELGDLPSTMLCGLISTAVEDKMHLLREAASVDSDVQKILAISKVGILSPSVVVEIGSMQKSNESRLVVLNPTGPINGHYFNVAQGFFRFGATPEEAEQATHESPHAIGPFLTFVADFNRTENNGIVMPQGRYPAYSPVLTTALDGSRTERLFN